EPPPLDPQPEASIEALTVALEEAAADDPALEARRDALLQAIAGLEVQGRALTALELQWIARARRALGEGPPAEPVQPEPPEPVALELAVHEPPSGLEAHSETPGSIRVAWSAGALSSGVVVERFAVERSVDGGAWAEVGSIAAVGSTEFEDTQVHDWSEYRYRVASLAALDSSAQGISLPDALRRQASEEVGPLRAVRRLYVVPVTVEPEKSAYIRVYGWDSEEAKFESKCFQVELGETIGAAIKRNARELNLATGAVLLASESGERKHPTQDFMQRYSAITVKWPDGTEEVVTDHDTPEAVQEDK
ncbi:MAG: fibronectin type III domain-containing protein, partial [Planctomycetes bacterium]|nr:fibronectin type III domain-containing protein [Planctomycetota bacterium]